MSDVRQMQMVLIPALLCDDTLYRDVISALGDTVEATVMLATQPDMRTNVAEILEKAPPQFVLVGSSFGGTVAIDIALAAPERVIALWLNDCDPGSSSADTTLGLAGMLETSADAAVNYLAGVVVRSTDTTSADTFRTMAARVGGMTGGAQARALAGRADAWDRLATLRMPVLVVWGSDDAIMPLSIGERLASTLPNVRYEVIADCGHLPVLEQPNAVTAIVREWLAPIIQH